MDAIQFQAEMGSDNTIRVPDGVRIPIGPVKVTIVPSEPLNQEKIPGTWQWLREIAAEAELIDPNLPTDMARNHDHYAHGSPRK
jgi:hypothetical protein